VPPLASGQEPGLNGDAVAHTAASSRRRHSRWSFCWAARSPPPIPVLTKEARPSHRPRGRGPRGRGPPAVHAMW